MDNSSDLPTRDTSMLDSQANGLSSSASESDVGQHFRPRPLHPLSLVFECLSLARRNLFPVLFAGFSAASGGVIGFWIGVCVFGIAVLISVFKFATFRYSIVGSDLVIQHGLIFRQHRTIPIARIQNIDMVQNPLHRLCGVAEVRVETASGSEPEATMRVLAVAELKRLRSSIFGDADESRSHGRPFDASQHEMQVQPGEQSVVLQVDAPSESLSKTSNATQRSELVCEIPTSRLLLAGLCSNRGAVFMGLLLSFLWQDRFAKMIGLNPASWSFDVPVAQPGAGGELRREMVRRGAAIRFFFHDLLSGHAVLLPLIYLTVFVLVAALVVKLLSAAWYVLRFHGYRLEFDGEDFRVRCGLFTKVSATVPRHRIQVISVHRPWLERMVGLAHIRIETAGGGKEDEDAASTIGRRWFLPVIRERDVQGVLQVLNPKVVSTEDGCEWQALSKRAGRRVMRMGIVVSLVITVFGVVVQPIWGWIAGVLALAGFWWLAKKKLKSRKFARTPWGVVLRSGIWYRKTTLTFFDKIQSVSLTQSPFDRRWHMAGLALDTLGAGPADHKIEIDMLDASDARSQYDCMIIELSDHTCKT
ncbi:MAG: PH domain-containing protein [Pirellula sp.]